MGSAWLTTTIVSPRWPGASRSERRPDAQLHLGEGLALGEAKGARRVLHRAPLGLLAQRRQRLAGPARRSRTRGVRARSSTRRPRVRRDRRRGLAGALERRGVERARGVGRVRRGDRRRVGLRDGPASDRCRPGARPGRTLPVVAVTPWRTSRMVVERGAGVRATVTYDARTGMRRGPGIGALGPALARDLGELVQQRDRAGVVVAGTGLDQPVLLQRAQRSRGPGRCARSRASSR